MTVKVYELVHDARAYWDLFNNWRLGSRPIARHDWCVTTKRLRAVEPILGTIEGKRVLDIGCGQRCQYPIMYRALGANATGIDLAPGRPRANVVGNFVRNLKNHGFMRAVKSLVRESFFDPVYFRELSSCVGRPLYFEGLDIRQMDAEHLDFPDATFDLATSSMVWEHLVDVDGATAEMARVLKPGGVVCMVIALFPGLGAGHHPSWTNPDEKPSPYVPPWDHLRGNAYPAMGYLNRVPSGRLSGHL